MLRVHSHTEAQSQREYPVQDTLLHIMISGFETGHLNSSRLEHRLLCGCVPEGAVMEKVFFFGKTNNTLRYDTLYCPVGKFVLDSKCYVFRCLSITLN